MLALAIAGISALLLIGLDEPAEPPDLRAQLPDMRREFSAITQAIGEAPQSPPNEMAKSDGVSIVASFAPKDRLAFTRAVLRAATALQYRAAGATRGEWLPEPDLMLFMCGGAAAGAGVHGARVLRVTEAGMGVAVSLDTSVRPVEKCAG